ncbi:MAG: DNA-binding response regulator [Planctomyces sp.]|nr:DNA-binding response regulator [Planctomyces sp.]
MARILIIEDQLKLQRNLQLLLETEGHEVVAVDSGETGYETAVAETFDAILLDLNLPGRDGLDVLAALRSQGICSPVLIITARDSIEERVAGLDRGADDYLIKPFAHAELLARLRALLRRGASTTNRLLHCRDVEVNVLLRTVTRGGVELDLSQREFELLEFLVRHKNTDVTREMLAREVWKEPGGMLTNAIDVCINGLRRKVERENTPQFIVTLRGVGYTVRDEP